VTDSDNGARTLPFGAGVTGKQQLHARNDDLLSSGFACLTGISRELLATCRIGVVEHSMRSPLHCPRGRTPPRPG
jgi:hypothetical protein